MERLSKGAADGRAEAICSKDYGPPRIRTRRKEAALLAIELCSILVFLRPTYYSGKALCGPGKAGFPLWNRKRAGLAH